MPRTNYFEENDLEDAEVADTDDGDDEAQTAIAPTVKAGKGKDSQDVSAKVVGSSWGAWKGSKNRSSFTQDFRPDEERVVVKFLEDEPFAVADRHWIDRKPYMCPASVGKPCPLCRMLGDRPTTTAFLNIAVIEEGGNVSHARWAATGRVARQLNDYSEDKALIKRLGRDDLYFSVQKSATGKKNQRVVTILPIKARDLSEDFGIDPLGKEELQRLRQKMDKADSIKFPSHDDLLEVAREKISGGTDY